MLEQPVHQKTKRSTSLATTLAAAFIVLSLISVALVSTIEIWLELQTQEALAINRQRIEAQEAAQEVSRFVDQIFSSLEAGAQVVDPFALSAEEQASFLQNLFGLQPAFLEISLLNDQGDEIAKLSRLSFVMADQLTNQANTDLFVQVSRKQRYISPVYIDDTTNEPLITIATPVLDVFDEFEGALVAEVNLKFMWDLISELRIGETGIAYVVDRQGNLLAFEDTSRVLRGENVSHLAEVAEFVERENALDELEEEENPVITGINGTDVLASYIPLGAPEWAVVVEQPAAEAYQELSLNLTLAIGAALIVAILAGLVGVYLARRLAAPLSHLTATATRIAGGELEEATVEGSTEVKHLAEAFNSMTGQLGDLIDSLEERVASRTQRLEIAASLSERLSAILNVEELLANVVNQIKENFGYYHAHIYLLDEKQQKLIVAAGTGIAGAEMKAQGHNISLLAPTSLVARAARTGEVVRVDNVREAPDWLPNPLLPDTHSEMAVPITLSMEGRTVGVLDVQQDKVAGLDEGDANLLRTLANQAAVGIRNARLFNQVETALAEARAAQELYLESTWEKTKILSQGGYHHYTHPDASSLDETTLITAKQEALAQARPAIVTLNGHHSNPTSIVAPVNLYNKTIGALQLHPASSDQAWTEDDLAIIEGVIDQIAQTAENIRLFEETRQQASFERLVGEITQKIREAPNMEVLAKTTAEALSAVLGVSDGIVQLNVTKARRQGAGENGHGKH